MKEEAKYTPAEEFANAFTHSIGALFSIYAIVMLAVSSHNAIEVASTAIFGSTLFILFQSSALYHAMVNRTAKKVFQKIDHSAIFMLIAGTYTPILLLVVPFPLSVALLAMTWYLAITGIIYSCLTLKFKYLSTGLYLVMGWLSLFLAYSIWTNTSHSAFRRRARVFCRMRFLFIKKEIYAQYLASFCNRRCSRTLHCYYGNFKSRKIG